LGDLSPTLVCRRRPDDALLLLGGDRGGDGSRKNKGKRYIDVRRRRYISK
jgi:hypothetical protein